MAYQYPPAGGEYGSWEAYQQDTRSPSATPPLSGRRYVYPESPRHYAYAEPRPATRAHVRHASSGFHDYGGTPSMSPSPRYTSTGQYATVNVSSATRHASRKEGHSRSDSRQYRRERERESGRGRRNSYSHHRPSDSHGESDEDEFFEYEGITYVLPARASTRNRTKSHRPHIYTENVYVEGGYGTDAYYYYQTASGQPPLYATARDGYFSPAYEQDYRASGTGRRASMSNPPRAATVQPGATRPGSSHKSSKKKAAPPKGEATAADAKKHRIPAGYSLKNWDPSEEPILLLGSVFDANSLGKWIYDWTVYHHGSATPISDMAGDLWLLLIQLAGKIKRAEECMPRIRAKDSREMVDDFVESGERLTDKLRKLLKACEQPMLRAASKRSKEKDAALGKGSGVEFVETLFGRERELEKTERFMQSVRLWNLRFDANCEEILKNPTR